VLERSKTAQFDKDHAAVAAFAKALAHPARVAILETLANRRSCICGELVDVLPLAQSTVSQHLKDLREAGLIKGEVEGPRSCYCIDPVRLSEMMTSMEEFLKVLRATAVPDSCC
jgi:DNA-binding transcriptional ArsR family regulator